MGGVHGRGGGVGGEEVSWVRGEHTTGEMAS